MQSFLNERTQTVRVGSAHSVESKVTSGVIQGSSLGTTLFNIYMSSLSHKLDIPVSLQHPYVRHEANASAFADDLKFIVNMARNHPDFTQANINCVFDWSVSRGIPLCLDKCVVLHCGKLNPHHLYQYGNSFLPVATSFRDLGSSDPATTPMQSTFPRWLREDDN